jgi:predicted nucleic acid-binding Zn ribbon protein
MVEAHVGALPEGMKRCKVCAEPINHDARKCIHCQSEQGKFRSRLGFSATVLSLLVALIAVLTSAIPAIVDVFTPKNSSLTVSVHGLTFERLAILVSNKGVRPGSVTGAGIRFGNEIVLLDFVQTAPVLIKPGESMLIYLDAQRGSFPEGPADGRRCALTVSHTDFTGQQDAEILGIACRHPFILARKRGS